MSTLGSSVNTIILKDTDDKNLEDDNTNDKANEDKSCDVTTTVYKSKINIDEIITIFKDKFLPLCISKGGPFKVDTIHVFFAFGSVVRFMKSDIDEKMNPNWEYSPKSNDYPIHRFKSKSEYKQIFTQYKTKYTQLLQDNLEYANIIKYSYYKLIKSGYPHPGDASADSIPIAMWDSSDDADINSTDFKSMSAVVFPMLDDILTVELFDKQTTIHDAHLIGREHRRYDYMMPMPVAILNHNCILTKLN
jgi:hypothetical protein